MQIVFMSIRKKIIWRIFEITKLQEKRFSSSVTHVVSNYEIDLKMQNPQKKIIQNFKLSALVTYFICCPWKLES
jgi:hypothetical protein